MAGKKRWVLAFLVAGTGLAHADIDIVTEGKYKHSATDFLHQVIPALAESRDAKEFTRHAPHPFFPVAMYARRIDLNLKATALLGKVIGYGEPKVTILLTQQPTGQRVAAGFSEVVTFEKGRVVFAGNLDNSAQPWGFFSLDILPQGRARAMLTWGQSSDAIPSAPYGGVDDEPGFESAMNNTLSSELDSEAFDEIDQEITEPALHDLRLKDGSSKLLAVYSGLSGILSTEQGRSTYYPIIQKWRSKEPQSGPAAIAEAEYWLNYGWDARGSGFSNSVTDAGDKLFEQRLQKAETILLASKSFASNNPLWYTSYMFTELGLGNIKKVQAAFEEGNKRYPYADTLYYMALRALQPRWYGSYAQEDALIKQAVEQTRAKEGEGLYARLYWALDDDERDQFELFRDSRASWPRMKQGFEDLMKHYPGSLWLLNNYAVYACEANDKTTFVKLNAQLQGQDVNKNDKLNESAWPSNHSHDLCEHIFGVDQ